VRTVDRWVGWCGTPRTQPDVRGNETVAGQKAAITALLGGYYLMRAGATYPCHAHYDSKTPGDAWPGGAKNAIIFLEFPLCLSRACLGKMIVYIYKLLKNGVFPQAALGHGTAQKASH
jgi:hypothetical protein